MSKRKSMSSASGATSIPASKQKVATSTNINPYKQPAEGEKAWRFKALKPGKTKGGCCSAQAKALLNEFVEVYGSVDGALDAGWTFFTKRSGSVVPMPRDMIAGPHLFRSPGACPDSKPLSSVAALVELQALIGRVCSAW